MAPTLKHGGGHNPEPSQPTEIYKQFNCWLQLFARYCNYAFAVASQLVEEDTSQPLDFGFSHVTGLTNNKWVKGMVRQFQA